MVRRNLLSINETKASCIFGPDMLKNFEANPFVNLAAYLVLINSQFALVSLGYNMQGQKLTMVYWICSLMIVQNFSTIILQSTFLCNSRGSVDDNGYLFWYSLVQQLANMQVYVTLIWT